MTSHISDTNIVDPFADVAEALLVGISARIQLPPSKYAIATERYEAVRSHIERPGSPLENRVDRFYPQGSMAIGSTISSHLQNDEYDIDIIAELALRRGMPPAQVLDIMYAAIRGEPGSLYYSMTERQSRCITVRYKDGMHLDITPAISATGEPRTSDIFHAKRGEPAERHFTLLANPWGFAEWFKQRTPPDRNFARAFARRAFDADGTVYAVAEAEEVPDQVPIARKSVTVVAHQLIKRSRNVRYDTRRNQRKPPSVLLAKIAADVPGQNWLLSDELLRQARQTIAVMKAAHSRGSLIDIRNPKCVEDRFTDRWPETLAAQGQYIGDLNHLVFGIDKLKSGDLDLEEMKEVLSDLFGEIPTAKSIAAFNAMIGRNVQGARIIDGRGGRVTAAPAIASTSAGSIMRPHTFFGWRPKS